MEEEERGGAMSVCYSAFRYNLTGRPAYRYALGKQFETDSLRPTDDWNTIRKEVATSR